jgi:hypothetical protein
MSKYNRLGLAGQVKHPYIRGKLSPNRRSERLGNAGVTHLHEYTKTADGTYFVPSFSIRRHLHRSEELLWDTNQKLIQRRLGRGYVVTSASDIAIKSIEQHRMIKNMREAEIHPDPDEIRDIAYAIRDQLTNLLANAHSPLAIPLGSLAKFGYQDNALAHTIEGWRGDRANYGQNDDEGYLDTRAVLLAERQLAVGALALAYGEEGLDTEGLAPCPHVTIARAKDSIPDYRLRGIQGELADLALEGAYFGDPIISIKQYRDEPAETIYVKHAWDSLAITA